MYLTFLECLNVNTTNVNFSGSNIDIFTATQKPTTINIITYDYFRTM